MKLNLASNMTPAAAAVVKASLCALTFAFADCIHSNGQSVMLADIAQSEELTYNEYSSLTASTARVYFLGNGDTELWTINSSPGNNSGPELLKKFNSASRLTVVGTRLYFVANDGVSGSELWRSDGTVAGTVRIKDIKPGRTGSHPDLLTNVKGTLYFSAHNGKDKKELWKRTGCGYW